MDKNKVVDCIRQFNRDYTVLLGFLNQNYLGTNYSVTETRVMFEIFNQHGISAKDLCMQLQLDKSYMSRIVRNFEKKDIIYRKVSEEDKRANHIYLTEKGRSEVKKLIATTNTEIEKLIEKLDEKDCEEICDAMSLITEKLVVKG